MFTWYRRHLPPVMTRHLSLGHELALIIFLKVIALMVIWYLFFSPAHRPPADTAAHLLGTFDPAQPHTPSGVK